MIENNNGTSQFLKGCNTDWNLNHEFICWLNYWLKEYKKNTKGMVDLTYHNFKTKKRVYTQAEIIDRLIELTANADKIYYDFEKEEVFEKTVDEIFELFHLVFWAMWW